MHFSAELLTYLVEFFPVRERFNFTLVCKEWYEILQSDVLMWKTYLKCQANLVMVESNQRVNMVNAYPDSDKLNLRQLKWLIRSVCDTKELEDWDISRTIPTVHVVSEPLIYEFIDRQAYDALLELKPRYWGHSIPTNRMLKWIYDDTFKPGKHYRAVRVRLLFAPFELAERMLRDCSPEHFYVTYRCDSLRYVMGWIDRTHHHNILDYILIAKMSIELKKELTDTWFFCYYYDNYGPRLREAQEELASYMTSHNPISEHIAYLDQICLGIDNDMTNSCARIVCCGNPWVIRTVTQDHEDPIPLEMAFIKYALNHFVEFESFKAIADYCFSHHEHHDLLTHLCDHIVDASVTDTLTDEQVIKFLTFLDRYDIQIICDEAQKKKILSIIAKENAASLWEIFSQVNFLGLYEALEHGSYGVLGMIADRIESSKQVPDIDPRRSFIIHPCVQDKFLDMLRNMGTLLANSILSCGLVLDIRNKGKRLCAGSLVITHGRFNVAYRDFPE